MEEPSAALEQETDSFGRLILIKRDERRRSRSRSRDRVQSSNNGRDIRPAGNKSFREQPPLGGGYSRSSRPYAYEYERRPPPPSGAMNPTNPASSYPPLKTYKSFMSTQHDDAPPEVFNRRYDEYRLNHVRSFIELFFETNKAEEWFMERYDPSKRQAMLAETNAWAQSESIEFKRCIDKDSNAMLLACSLEPSANNSGWRSADEGDEPFSGRHLSGHVDCAICLTGVPAVCSKAILKSTIAEVVPNSLRLLVTQPRWRQSKELGRTALVHERTAWLIMPSPAAAKEALDAMQNFRITLSGPIDPTTGQATPLFSFCPQSFLYQCGSHGTSPLHEAMSEHKRIVFDTARAVQLAAVLDEYQDISADATLASILLSLETSELFRSSPTHKLDVALAYLRRVHLVAYYSALRFRDEAHLMSIVPEVIFRGAPYFPEMEFEREMIHLDSDAGYEDLLRIASLEAIGKRSKQTDGAYVLSDDEIDARFICDRSEQLLDELALACAMPEVDGKGRCGFKWCGKLFKGSDYLLKHIKSRHAPDFAPQLLVISLPFMKARYDAEDVALRPLPPIEVETAGQTVELAPVHTLLEQCLRAQQAPPPPIPNYPLHLDNRRDYGGRGGRRQDSRQNFSGYQSRGDRVRLEPPLSARDEGPQRPLNKYADTAAPKETVASLDYGVAILPPPRRRKLLTKAQKSSDELQIDATEAISAGTDGLVSTS